jgi:hypothetical protein
MSLVERRAEERSGSGQALLIHSRRVVTITTMVDDFECREKKCGIVDVSSGSAPQSLLFPASRRPASEAHGVHGTAYFA